MLLGMIYLYVLYVLLFCFFALLVFFFKQKTAYEMRISDWSSDVCSSDLVLGIGGIAGHVFAGLEPGQPGYFSREALTQCYSAVTAACLVTRREIYEQLGGLDEDNLGVAFNDVDYCLRVWESSHSVVWTPFAELYHHESASRGSDEDPTRRARFRKAVQHMRERWQAPIAADPHYNPKIGEAHV